MGCLNRRVEGACTRTFRSPFLVDTDTQASDMYLRLVVPLGGALRLLLEPLPLHVGVVELRVRVAHLALRHEELEAVFKAWAQCEC